MTTYTISGRVAQTIADLDAHFLRDPLAWPFTSDRWLRLGHQVDPALRRCSQCRRPFDSPLDRCADCRRGPCCCAGHDEYEGMDNVVAFPLERRTS